MTEQEKFQFLETLYEMYPAWLGETSFVCQKGCSSCCTQSVNATSLEVFYIINNLRKLGRTDLLSHLENHSISSNSSQITTNKFAHFCLNQQELPDEGESWNLSPCPFLSEDCCSIYTVRPFGCRSFFSTVLCSENGEARVPPWIITLNTVIMQLLEHIDDRGKWGNLAALLIRAFFPARKGASLPDTERLSGFLIPEEEKPIIADIFNDLLSVKVGASTFLDLAGINVKM